MFLNCFKHYNSFLKILLFIILFLCFSSDVFAKAKFYCRNMPVSNCNGETDTFGNYCGVYNGQCVYVYCSSHTQETCGQYPISNGNTCKWNGQECIEILPKTCRNISKYQCEGQIDSYGNICGVYEDSCVYRKCSSHSVKTCGQYKISNGNSCKWDSEANDGKGKCIEVGDFTDELAEDPTIDDSSLNCNSWGDAKKDLQNIFNFLKVLIPLIIIGVSSFDFIKAITQKNDKDIKKSFNRLLKRFVYAVIFFFIPIILEALLYLFEINNNICLK